MAYKYETQKPFIFTEDGQDMFLKVRDTSKALLSSAGAVSCECLIRELSGGSWDMLACVDRLVEIGELIEVKHPFSRAGQHRLFIGK